MAAPPEVGIQRKLTAHLAACREAGVDFYPIVAESLGGRCQDTILFIREIGSLISQRVSKFDSADPTSQLFNHVAIALWRGNARLWCHREPSLPSSVDGVI